MGMDDKSIAHNEAELRDRVNWVIQNYKQPALVEEYLSGREFTIGVLGRPDAALYSRKPELYEANGFHRFPVLEVDASHAATPGVYGYLTKTLHTGDEGVPGFLCPADVDPDLAYKLHTLAYRAHMALGALDVSRVDIRLDSEGNPRLLEINSLPGLTPDFSDLCVISKAEGLTYQELVLEILYLGASRYGMVIPHDEPSFDVALPVPAIREMARSERFARV